MSEQVKPQGCTNLKLRQLVRVVGAHYDAEVGKTGLKTTQYSLLSYICKLGPIRAVEVAPERRDRRVGVAIESALGRRPGAEQPRNTVRFSHTLILPPELH